MLIVYNGCFGIQIQNIKKGAMNNQLNFPQQVQGFMEHYFFFHINSKNQTRALLFVYTFAGLCTLPGALFQPWQCKLHFLIEIFLWLMYASLCSLWGLVISCLACVFYNKNRHHFVNFYSVWRAAAFQKIYTFVLCKQLSINPLAGPQVFSGHYSWWALHLAMTRKNFFCLPD